MMRNLKRLQYIDAMRHRFIIVRLPVSCRRGSSIVKNAHGNLLDNFLKIKDKVNTAGVKGDFMDRHYLLFFGYYECARDAAFCHTFLTFYFFSEDFPVELQLMFANLLIFRGDLGDRTVEFF